MCLFLHVEAGGYPPCHTWGYHLPLLEHLSLNLEPSKSAGLTSLDPPIPDFLALELKTYATVSRLFCGFWESISNIQIFMWVLGVKFRSSCLRRHFTHLLSHLSSPHPFLSSYFFAFHFFILVPRCSLYIQGMTSSFIICVLLCFQIITL